MKIVKTLKQYKSIRLVKLESAEFGGFYAVITFSGIEDGLSLEAASGLFRTLKSLQR